jgi:hypothetical protein
MKNGAGGMDVANGCPLGFVVLCWTINFFESYGNWRAAPVLKAEAVWASGWKSTEPSNVVRLRQALSHYKLL